MRVIALVLALLLSTFNVQTEYDKNSPLGKLGPIQQNLRYDEHEHVWHDRNFEDLWITACRYSSPGAYALWHDGFIVPVRHHYVITLNEHLYRNQEDYQIAVLGMALAPRRFVGINVEGKQNWPGESRVWPHLGINYVGTVAERAGYEVVLWDELIQGPAPMDQLIQPGDIVGLSLVTTGIDRGVTQLAPKAKKLGAQYVVAGNDAAMFRAPQLLRTEDIDAVFTSDSLVAVASFFHGVRRTSLEELRIPYLATRTTGAPHLSNEELILRANAGKIGVNELFTTPNLRLFGDDYWEKVWAIYRSVYGHKHAKPEQVKNALGLLAHGCGRAGAKEACYYCTIGGVADVRIPDNAYLEQTIAMYQDFGVNTFFNVADSSVEMGTLLDGLESIHASFDTLVMYGRAQIIASRPDLLERWVGRARERLLINCGMDSADENILQNSIIKSSSTGNRLNENRRALRRIKEAGPCAHLHFSLIFGSPGETEESCKRNLDFVDETIAMLGNQLDVVESDIWWVNFGAPCSEIFRSYDAAKRLADVAGKTISVKEWEHDFAQHAEALSVPWSCEESWYRYFTNISIEQAQGYMAQVEKKMEKVPGHVTGRKYSFKPPVV